MKYHENIEKIFIDDIREKRKVGRGSFSKVGKGGERARVRGGLKTPYDFMKTKERKKLNSEVRSFNMYETIIPIDEFRLKDEETQRNMLIRWREIYENGQIKKGLGIANSPYYKLIDELNLPKKPRGGANNTGKKLTRKSKSVAVSPVTLLDIAQEEEKKSIEEVTDKVIKALPQLFSKGLHLEYNGTYNVEELSKMFTKLQLLVDGETNKYHISLSLSEIIEN